MAHEPYLRESGNATNVRAARTAALRPACVPVAAWPPSRAQQALHSWAQPPAGPGPASPLPHPPLPCMTVQVVTFLKWANQQPNTWFLTYQQLIAYYSAVSLR